MFKKTRKTKKASLSLAPMLDMIFILLIFFVVSTTFSKLPGVHINRPNATTSDQLPPNNILIGITKEGRYFIHNKEYVQDTLKTKLQLKYDANPNLAVLIMADEESALKHSITIMDLCKQIGINQVAIAEEIE
ncbi:biopolymer transporter ExbD [Candidatus Marinamargulisbacteria bacterium SCGC AG-414-C22]|nr:biopolymer transporter ExbD [Candidatus Marinamargulisbacteria bacterium SCGC AG-414-C22]